MRTKGLPPLLQASRPKTLICWNLGDLPSWPTSSSPAGDALEESPGAVPAEEGQSKRLASSLFPATSSCVLIRPCPLGRFNAAWSA